jgi:hypothetical protein
MSLYGSGDPCAYKLRCVVVFLAPWCPSCQGSVPFLNDMRKRFDQEGKVGVKVIVGMDSEEKLTSMAKKIGGEVFLDSNKEFSRSAGVRGVPAWWVVDDKKRILARGTALGVSGGTQEQNFTYFAVNYLKLKDFLPDTMRAEEHNE